eukprot:scaffold3236_cov66-Cylindrotheca_fusiformis.AAC.4
MAANPSSSTIPFPAKKKLQYVFNPTEGTVLLDHNGTPLSVDRLLSTKPLRSELSTRPGPGNKKLTYMSGDCISRTLNDIFGFDGWNLDIVKVHQEAATEQHGKHTVVYTAQVRLTHKSSGAYKEDVGSGDATDRVFGNACSNAIKSSITDAMKRAARHFGDKLGNCTFTFNKAPTSLKEALDKYDIERANSKFGFPKDQAKTNNTSTVNKENFPSPQSNTSAPPHPVSSIVVPRTTHHGSRNDLLPVSTKSVLTDASSNRPSTSNTSSMDARSKPNSHSNTTSHHEKHTDGLVDYAARPTSSRGRGLTDTGDFPLVTPVAVHHNNNNNTSNNNNKRPNPVAAAVWNPNNTTSGKRPCPTAPVNPYASHGRTKM